MNAVVLTKDADFVELLERLGPPPRILWLTCGNTSEARLQRVLYAAWPRIVELLAAGESLVEISDPAPQRCAAPVGRFSEARFACILFDTPADELEALESGTQRLHDGEASPCGTAVLSQALRQLEGHALAARH